MAGCFGVVGGCWGLAPLTGHDPPGCWVSGRGAVGDGGDAVVGDAAPAAGGACQRGRGGLLLGAYAVGVQVGVQGVATLDEGACLAA